MRSYRLVKMIALKNKVDSARCTCFPSNAGDESNWLKNPLKQQESFFITTNQFPSFLDSNNFDYPGRTARAVLVTLAVLAPATSWPPPDEVIKDILKLLRATTPTPIKPPSDDLRTAYADVPTGVLEIAISERAARVPEIVIAYLLGWGRPDLNKSGVRWQSALAEARACLRAVMYVSTDTCLNWLHRYVIGFPDEDTGYWTSQIFNRFTVGNPLLRCLCFVDIAPPGIRIEDIPHLVGNAFSRAETCFYKQHHLSLWVPHKLPLWLFAQRAVKGFIGKFKPGQFPTGMLCTLLRRQSRAQDNAAITLAKVARHYCNQCEEWTVTSSCPTEECNQRELDLQYSYLKASRFLILDGEEGGFTPRPVWTCQGPASELSIEVNKGEEKLCKNIYLRSRCDRKSCAQIHDQCPLHSCGTPHPLGAARRLSEVYFYNEDLPRMAQLPQFVPPVTDVMAPLTSVIDQAAADALEKFADTPRWVEQIILLLAEDFERWIGLIQTAGDVNWHQLWNALKDAPGRPVTPSELQADFERDVKPALCKTFRYKFEIEGLDWSLVEKYRPLRSENKEGLE